jgi:hypothetical protein
MVEINKTLKELANKNFKHTLVFERTPKALLSMFNAPVHKSENMRMFPEVDEVEVKEIDALHDEVTLLWSDLRLKGVMSWVESKSDEKRKAYRLESYE